MSTTRPMPKWQQVLITAAVPSVTGLASAILWSNSLYAWIPLPISLAIAVPLFAYLLETKRAIVALLMEVCRELQVPAEAHLRCAVFKPCWRQRALKEYARYSNPEERKQKTRMLICQGVAGRCYRTRAHQNVPIMKDNFLAQHVMDLGFMPKEAARFKQDRESYLCVPVQNASGDVSAILSFDSSQANIFTRDKIDQIDGYVFEFNKKLTL